MKSLARSPAHGRRQRSVRARPPELTAAVDNVELARLFATYRKLGTLQKLDAPTGTTKSTVGVGSMPTGLTAEYQFPATFSGGSATVRVQLVFQRGEWKLQAFSVNSSVFLPAAQ